MTYRKYIIFIIVGLFSYKLFPVIFQLGEFYRMSNENVWKWIIDLSGSIYFLISLIFIIVSGISIANLYPWLFGLIVVLFAMIFSAFIYPCNLIGGEVDTPIFLIFLLPIVIFNVTKFIRK